MSNERCDSYGGNAIQNKHSGEVYRFHYANDNANRILQVNEKEMKP